MATSRTPPSAAKTNFGALDKVPSSTLKRNPKMELSKADLLKLLTYLEGELQAREIVIATLKAERVKQLLYQAKYGQFTLNDPFAALQRDSYGAYNPNCDEAAIKAMYNNQLSQLENLILQHRRAQQRLRQHLYDAEQQHSKVVSDLEDEIRKHAQDTAQGDDVTYMLEKERERLHQEVELERQQNKKLERELKKVLQAMEQDKLRHKQIVMLLLEERKRILTRLVDVHNKNEEMEQFLTMEKGRMADVVEGLEEESKKSLQMEADLEHQAAEFARERELLNARLRQEMDTNKQLMETIEALKRELSNHPRNASKGVKDVFRFSENLLVKTDDNTSDVDSTDSEAMLKTPPTVRENVTAATNLAIMTNTNGSMTFPTNTLHCTASNSPPAPPAKPAILRSSVVSGPTPSPSFGDSSPKMVSPRFPKSLSPVSTVATGASVSPSTNSTTIVKMVRAVTPSPVSPPLQSQSEPNARNVVSASISPPSPVLTGTQTAPVHVVCNASQQQQQQQQPPPPPAHVQVTPRVSLSTGPGTRVYTTTQGGKVTFHVTAPPPQPPKKPPQLTTASASAAGVGRGAPPPVPPNKPVLPKKDNALQAAAVKGPSSLKFGITISKAGDTTVNNMASASSHVVLTSSSSAGGPTVITASSMPSSTAASSSSPIAATEGATVQTVFKETQPVLVTACSKLPSTKVTKMTDDDDGLRKTDSVNVSAKESVLTSEYSAASVVVPVNLSVADETLAPELADFQQLLVSMASTNISSGHSAALMSSGDGDDVDSSSAVHHYLTVETSSSFLHQNGVGTMQSSPSCKLAIKVDDSFKVYHSEEEEEEGLDKKRSSAGLCRSPTKISDETKLSLLSGSYSRDDTTAYHRQTTRAFNPCVRKVISPSLPKSFNHMDL